MLLQAQKGNHYFTEQAERVEYGNYVLRTQVLSYKPSLRPSDAELPGDPVYDYPKYCPNP